MEKLFKIQQKIKVPKTHYNKFGDFYYRNADDILQALKPLLKELKCIIKASYYIESYNSFNYVFCKINLISVDTDEKHEVTGMARETVEKKKMGSEQLTGSATSYAKKYALDALLGIDDGVDSDKTNTSLPEKKPGLDLTKINEIVNAQIATKNDVCDTCQKMYGTSDPYKLTQPQVDALALAFVKDKR